MLDPPHSSPDRSVEGKVLANIPGAEAKHARDVHRKDAPRPRLTCHPLGARASSWEREHPARTGAPAPATTGLFTGAAQRDATIACRAHQRGEPGTHLWVPRAPRMVRRDDISSRVHPRGEQDARAPRTSPVSAHPLVPRSTMHGLISSERVWDVDE